MQGAVAKRPTAYTRPDAIAPKPRRGDPARLRRALRFRVAAILFEMSVGAVLDGRFELLAEASVGGMGWVYRGRDRETGRTVAIKVLRIERPSDLARFARESNLLATVRHQNVVGYVAHGADAGVHYLAEDWIDGSTLSAYQRSKGIDLREAVTIAIEVAAALAAAHELGVIHRDIKPSNILLEGGRPDAVKVVDFGIARLATEAGLLTRTGVMIGTPPYMSPEQTRGKTDIDSASDVWSLGCVLYQMMTGRVAFGGKTAASVRARVLLAEPTALVTACPEAPPELIALVDAMLDKASTLRPADGNAALARLRALPPMPDSPRRGSSASEATTSVMPGRERTPRSSPEIELPNAFVFLAPFEPPEDDRQHGAQVEQLASRHDLSAHVFEDGSALLQAKGAGKSGALAAARAAIAASEHFDGGVALFARGVNDTIEESFDRGAVMLERATLTGAIGSLDDDAALAEIRVDHVIAELIAAELPVGQTPEGPVLRVQGRRG